MRSKQTFLSLISLIWLGPIADVIAINCQPICNKIVDIEIYNSCVAKLRSKDEICPVACLSNAQIVCITGVLTPQGLSQKPLSITSQAFSLAIQNTISQQNNQNTLNNQILSNSAGNVINNPPPGGQTIPNNP